MISSTLPVIIRSYYVVETISYRRESAAYTTPLPPVITRQIVIIPAAAALIFAFFTKNRHLFHLQGHITGGTQYRKGLFIFFFIRHSPTPPAIQDLLSLGWKP